jgi:diguanylate cyclase
MDADKPIAGVPAQLAKGALRRLAQSRLEPTPVNFARAYAEEAGGAATETDALPTRARPVLERLAMRASDDAAQRGELVAGLMAGRWDDAQRLLERQGGAAAPSWHVLLERLARGLDRGGRQWTLARKKDSLQRLLDTSRSDSPRLQQRLAQLLSTWEADQPDLQVEPAGTAPSPIADTAMADQSALAVAADHHPQVVAALQATVRAGLPDDEPRARELADELAGLAERIADEGATITLAEAVAEVCQRVRRLFGLRQELVHELLGLTRSLTEGITDLAEDGSWAQGQGASLRQRLDGPTHARAVRAARDLLDQARQQQRHLQRERQQTRDALKQMVQQVLSELGTLDSATGAFNDKLQAYATVIESAESLESLDSVVREMATDSRQVHQVVSGVRQRLASEHARGAALEAKVRDLEAELRRLSDEVSTDALTQVANRRGLSQAFEVERARAEREGPTAAPLAVGLIDIDNFKRLNDTLGHAAGDVALKSLAARVTEWLRPVDHVARFGGEEFVVLLPGTAVEEAQQVLTRLQRQLTASLFMHDGQEVFVTFSAGVTRHRSGEALELALERADEALYEAKRTGKNRTCIA